MTAHENNPWSKAFRDRIKRERWEREEQARRQHEECQLQEREARERHEKEERQRQEKEARERHEREEREHQEKEARELQEREMLENQEKEEREYLQQEEQKRQKLEEEDKKQIKLKEVEEIKGVLKDDFKNPYKAINFLKLLSNLQYLHSISDTQSIEYIDILSISDQANINELSDHLKIQISKQLPKIPGNFSAFVIMIDDEYATMVVHNTTEGMEVKFNDPKGIPMPSVLRQIMVDILGTKPVDFHICIEGPSDVIATKTLLEFMSSPDIVILIPEALEPEQNKLLRVLHVLYSCDLIQDIILEADKFLNIFYTAHKMQDVITIEASTRAILNYFSTFGDIKVSDMTLLYECQIILSALPISKTCSDMIRFVMQGLTKAPIDDEEEFVMLDSDDLDGEECIIKASGPESPIFEDYLGQQPN